jgi:hypothetical protein
LSKAAKADRGMTQNDSIGLCREQHAELYASDGTLRLIVDHPSNARLIGTCPQASLVRAADLTVEAGDEVAVVYIARAGAALRIATAKAVRRPNGVIGLTEWRVEPGFDHAAATEGGGTIHRLARTPGAPR